MRSDGESLLGSESVKLENNKQKKELQLGVVAVGDTKLVKFAVWGHLEFKGISSECGIYTPETLCALFPPAFALK